ncbi:hypothetical protein Tco_0733434 [Tanacetum coccineum]
MLVESDYDSWKIRIHRYIRGKPLGKLIWNSIQNGPSPHPMVTDAPTEGQTEVNMPRMKLDSEFTPEETNRENADTQAEIILSQGLPRHIFNILNQTNTAKEIWDNVEMLMQGSGRTLQQRKEDLFDEFERFCAIGNEPIHDYFVRFHKLVNDMKITQLAIPTHQLNTKFVNNLPSYWGKYVTNDVGNTMDQRQSSYGNGTTATGKKGDIRGKWPKAAAASWLTVIHMEPMEATTNQELSARTVYWLPVNEIASQTSTPTTPVTLYVLKNPPPSQVLATLHKIKAVFSHVNGS